ncbi:hypothetical protein GE061_005263 [Apolygus lucorum]|uniref:Uncharacterized protein n=1 Tax=Apolygus lucorum TaxID=248454 RepID=A0A8S9WYC9_APOLU|nr:hypothetical protein GE061_005263 [Apolygus lucorum]
MGRGKPLVTWTISLIYCDEIPFSFTYPFENLFSHKVKKFFGRFPAILAETRVPLPKCRNLVDATAGHSQRMYFAVSTAEPAFNCPGLAQLVEMVSQGQWPVWRPTKVRRVTAELLL